MALCPSIWERDMCNPVVLAAAAAAVSIAGTMYGAISASQQSKYEAGVADQNAKLSNEQAKDSIMNNQTEALRLGRQTGALKGQQQAALAANGVDIGDGSALQIAQDTAMLGNEDAAQLYKAGFERTRGYEISAYNYRSSAAASRAAAKSAIVGGVLKSFSTALGAGSQISGMNSSVSAPTMQSTYGARIGPA